MKKIALIAALAAMGATALSAQDFQKATELAKSANEALIGGDFQTAITNFEAAKTEAGQCTEEESASLVENCVKGLIQANYSMANSMVKNGQLQEAIDQFAATVALAKEAADDETVQKAQEKTTQLHQAIANAKVKALQTEKDPARKAEICKEVLNHINIVLASDPDNGKAFLLKGQILTATGKQAEAMEAYLSAKGLGEEKTADKQISTLLLKEAATRLKNKDSKGAIEAAVKSIEYFETANAYKIAGTASNAIKDYAAAEKYLSKYLELSPNAKDAEQIKAAVTALQANLKK